MLVEFETNLLLGGKKFKEKRDQLLYRLSLAHETPNKELAKIFNLNIRTVKEIIKKL